ncbi:Biofilm growth-associated repressor [Corynebacterium occultum]|uniref:Biofilm growth-associated repressor n=1 Tax=Corynebacterium occultum TaxID=2675219 RepID=A0A6B8WC95_9CORY|nr:metalloregulator ArsR/SmtB family transcription factor [Corynebacterium occultum]QGU08496.1 Biofilm growth-associated repressor [Corynebacterium occultum]
MTTGIIGIEAQAENIKSLSVAFKALANESRLALAAILASGEKSVGALAAELDMGVTTVSAHLQVLRRAGLVETRREGTTVYYHLVRDELARVRGKIREIGLNQSPRMASPTTDYLE